MRAGGGGGLSFNATGDLLYDACIFIAAHGAGLNNMFMMRPGCTVIEVGFVDPGFHLPSDYYCAARNLQMRYYLSLATSGDYMSSLHVDVDEVLAILGQVTATTSA